MKEEQVSNLVLHLNTLERLMVTGIDIMKNLINRLDTQADHLSIDDMVSIDDAEKYFKLVAEECPSIKDEIEASDYE